jgi:hypothetical protein
MKMLGYRRQRGAKLTSGGGSLLVIRPPSFRVEARGRASTRELDPNRFRGLNRDLIRISPHSKIVEVVLWRWWWKSGAAVRKRLIERCCYSRKYEREGLFKSLQRHVEFVPKKERARDKSDRARKKRVKRANANAIQRQREWR